MKDVVGFEGRYGVTSCGKVWSYKYKRLLAPQGGEDYQMVGLYKDGKYTYDYVHRLVAKAYIPNPDPEKYTEVNHKDEVRNHNWVNNLEWCTRNYNINYGARNDKVSKAVYCVELDKRFKSIVDAAKATGIHQGNLSSLLKHHRENTHTLGGYHWRYAD